MTSTSEVGSNLSIVLFRQEWRHAIPSLSNLEVPAGYFENGTLVMESQKVACHYLKRAFIFDFAASWLNKLEGERERERQAELVTHPAVGTYTSAASRDFLSSKRQCHGPLDLK